MEKLTRREQKVKTRAGLVKQAEWLFSAHGIAQTSTAEIAKSLNVSHGTLFVHFPTRDELVKAVVDEFGERLSVKLDQGFSGGMTLAELLSSHISVLAEFEDFYLRLISESRMLQPRIRSIVFAINASLSYRFFRAAKIEMNAGKIKKMNQIRFFNTWMSMLHYTIMNRDLFSDKTPILNEVGGDLVRNFLFLIKT